MAATAADEPSEAGSAASELASVRRPEGLKWLAHEAKRSAKVRNDHAELWNTERSGIRRGETPGRGGKSHRLRMARVTASPSA